MIVPSTWRASSRTFTEGITGIPTATQTQGNQILARLGNSQMASPVAMSTSTAFSSTVNHWSEASATRTVAWVVEKWFRNLRKSPSSSSLMFNEYVLLACGNKELLSCSSP